jgi:pimeloyl-ACP methyl ester carboxylesterase
LLIVLGAGWAWASGRVGRAVLAVQILDDLRRPGTESWLKRSTPPPTRITTSLTGKTQRFAADVYGSSEASGGAPLLFIPGLVPEGKDDARVRPFAELLARAGYLVVVPDLPSLRSLRVHPEQVEELGAAFDALTADAELAPRGRAGTFAVSYAAGLALLAALDPARAPRATFLATVGGYADLDTVLRFLATGLTFVDGRTRRIEPDLYGQLVFLRTYEPFVTSSDRQVLEAMVARRFRNPKAALADLAADLSPSGRLIYDLFETASPDRVPGLIERLPSEMRHSMAALSPARRSFSSLKARLYIVHARDDGTFPVSQAHELARRARPSVPVRLVVVDALLHVEPRPWSRDPWGFLTRDVPEAVRLAAWWYALLGERERLRNRP